MRIYFNALYSVVVGLLNSMYAIDKGNIEHLMIENDLDVKDKRAKELIQQMVEMGKETRPWEIKDKEGLICGISWVTKDFRTEKEIAEHKYERVIEKNIQSRSYELDFITKVSVCSVIGNYLGQHMFPLIYGGEYTDIECLDCGKDCKVYKRKGTNKVLKVFNSSGQEKEHKKRVEIMKGLKWYSEVIEDIIDEGYIQKELDILEYDSEDLDEIVSDALNELRLQGIGFYDIYAENFSYDRKLVDYADIEDYGRDKKLLPIYVHSLRDLEIMDDWELLMDGLQDVDYYYIKYGSNYIECLGVIISNMYNAFNEVIELNARGNQEEYLMKMKDMQNAVRVSMGEKGIHIQYVCKSRYERFKRRAHKIIFSRTK